MTKRLKSKHKVDRRLKANLWGRPKSPFNVRAYPPGQHGQSKKGKPTDYGIQLQAKQKLKAYYGNINERQFRNIYRKALSKRGDTSESWIACIFFVMNLVKLEKIAKQYAIFCALFKNWYQSRIFTNLLIDHANSYTRKVLRIETNPKFRLINP